jgi:four helix bundle protein
MATIKNFEDLEIWQLARVLNEGIFKLITETPLSNDYKLKDQINGSTGSIMDNIAEGFERDGNLEFKNFLSIAKGSCGECRSQLYRVFDRKYIEENEFVKYRDKSITLSRKIASFMIYLSKNDFKGNKFIKP